MRVYRESKMSESQKEKVRLYNKQRAAAQRLEQKVSLDKKRENWRKEKATGRQKQGKKCRILQKSKHFEKLVNDICHVAKLL